MLVHFRVPMLAPHLSCFFLRVATDSQTARQHLLTSHLHLRGQHLSLTNNAVQLVPAHKAGYLRA